MLHAARVIRGRRVHGSILVLSWSVSRVLELTQTHFHMHTDSHGVYSCASCSLRGFQAVPVRHRGEPGHTRDTHGTHTGHAGAQRHTDHADEPHNHPNPQQHTSRTSARRPKPRADSTATGPEPTAPRGRLRRGHPHRTRPCLHPTHPLPERLPAPARRRSARNEGGARSADA